MLISSFSSNFISVFSIFQIVKFNNDHCTAIDGSIGTCYTASECTTKGGEERGNCASGFGVCCVGKSFSSPSPVLTTDKLSDVGRVSLSLTELEQYSCLVGKVYWEAFNCFTMSVFTCFSCVPVLYLWEIIQSKYLIKHRPRLVLHCNQGFPIPNHQTTPNIKSVQMKTRSLFLWWFDKIVWHMSLYCVFTACL